MKLLLIVSSVLASVSDTKIHPSCRHVYPSRFAIDAFLKILDQTKWSSCSISNIIHPRTSFMNSACMPFSKKSLAIRSQTTPNCLTMIVGTQNIKRQKCSSFQMPASTAQQNKPVFHLNVVFCRKGSCPIDAGPQLLGHSGGKVGCLVQEICRSGKLYVFIHDHAPYFMSLYCEL